MSYTLGQAARATGMSKAAISRAIKQGTISAERQPDGSFRIDPAELHRVYPAQRSTPVQDDSELNGEMRELRTRLEAAEQRLRDWDTVIVDLREDRDRWRSQAERLLLNGPPSSTAPEHPPRRRWWPWRKG